jgi:hypothetical protein
MLESNAPPPTTSEGAPYRVLAGDPRQRLVFSHGASRVTLESVPDARDAIETDFDGGDVRVSRTPHEIRIGYHWSLLGYAYDLLLGGPAELPRSTIRLDEGHVWDIVCDGGASNLDGHLERLRLASFAVRGGASDVSLRLGRPSGVVPVRVLGGVGRVELSRPKGVGVRLRVRGGISRLRFDAMELASVGGGLALDSRAGAEADDRYEIEIVGGVGELSIA